ncbi:MAG: hypothetical protein IPM06_00970 [Rhizobiales bacterium]|nr:hypothetical protein [Hyphomicrobiales bacterium]
MGALRVAGQKPGLKISTLMFLFAPQRQYVSEYRTARLACRGGMERQTNAPTCCNAQNKDEMKISWCKRKEMKV